MEADPISEMLCLKKLKTMGNDQSNSHVQIFFGHINLMISKSTE
jgi:hypothetical protein